MLYILQNLQHNNLFQVLELNPTDGHAKSHVGFILKALNKLEESIKYFEEGIHSGHPGADDAKFFYHLGDAYHRIGKPDKVCPSQ